jgi:hypothetical protein
MEKSRSTTHVSGFIKDKFTYLESATTGIARRALFSWASKSKSKTQRPKYNDQLKSVNKYFYLEKSTKLCSRLGESPKKSSSRSKKRMYEVRTAQIYLLQWPRYNKSSILRCYPLFLLMVRFESFILLFGAGTSNHFFELLYHIRILHYVSMKSLGSIKRKFLLMTRVKRVLTTQDLVITPQFSTSYRI